jgi:hypothetical protein
VTQLVLPLHECDVESVTDPAAVQSVADPAAVEAAINPTAAESVTEPLNSIAGPAAVDALTETCCLCVRVESLANHIT